MDFLSAAETQGSDHREYNKYALLEAYLKIPLVHSKELPKLIEHVRYNENVCGLLPDSVCVLFEIDQSINTLFRLTNLAFHLTRIRSARHKFFLLTGTNPRLVGIYPSVVNPTLIFELETTAAEYVKNHVFPQPRKQPGAFLKDTMEKLLKVNPGVAALGMVVRLR